ncbi:outer membrane protein assembly factor BamE [Roseomonas populi]|uniref:Outer membrane protein assembly factor BamE n=1 Tax=Roseomonas populi TaxID=3121582 RepID=A0ABT1X2D5_9PROT|nr:outer membrane protein assembly factor BamE [Roseomonas pecuniae]MCR0982255.1 outer membrane protein assembly factor BamE [Roseomonas pecuniae]
MIRPILILAGLLAGCATAGDHAAQVGAGGATDERLALGTVQRQIRIGMTNAEVVAVLGAPNMVTTDDRRRENWVYDRVSSESAYSSGAAGANVLFLGAVSSSGASRRSQRTLTIIIRYDEGGRVRDFSYRSSSF